MYESTRYPLRPHLTEAHAQVWADIGRPGAFWSGSDRTAFVSEARAALDCRLCAARAAAISPYAVDGDHDAATGLAPHLVELIHRIRVDPGRITKTMFDDASGRRPDAGAIRRGRERRHDVGDHRHLAQRLGPRRPRLVDRAAGRAHRAAHAGCRRRWGMAAAVSRRPDPCGVRTTPSAQHRPSHGCRAIRGATVLYRVSTALRAAEHSNGNRPVTSRVRRVAGFRPEPVFLLNYLPHDAAPCERQERRAEIRSDSRQRRTDRSLESLTAACFAS